MIPRPPGMTAAKRSILLPAELPAKKKKSKVSALRTIRISEARTVGSFVYADGECECNLELDSHADTTVGGKHSLLLQDYGEPIKVVVWNTEAESQTLRTVSAAVL